MVKIHYKYSKNEAIRKEKILCQIDNIYGRMEFSMLS